MGFTCQHRSQLGTHETLLCGSVRLLSQIKHVLTGGNSINDRYITSKRFLVKIYEAGQVSHDIPHTIFAPNYRNPTLAKCEDETHTPKVGDLESFRTLEPLELNSRGQNTSHWGVLYINGKVLKFRCPKWPRMSHLDIYSPSYGQKKGRESNCQFDSRPLNVRKQPLPDV